MNKILLTALISAPLLCTNVSADTTFGVGVGSMYSGLGINFGRTDGTSLTFGSLGCYGGSYSSGTGNSTYETNCGVGVGYISSALLPGKKQGLGLSLGLSYNTDKYSSSGAGIEWNLTPSYHYFFNGVNALGLNLGFGPRLTFSEDESLTTGLMLNIGFQF